MKRALYRGGRALAAALAAGVLLTGCGSEFPTLTQEEYDMIVDYSAGVLSKYNMYNGDKLTKVAALTDEEEDEQQAAPEPEKPAPTQEDEQPDISDSAEQEQDHVSQYDTEFSADDGDILEGELESETDISDGGDTAEEETGTEQGGAADGDQIGAESEDAGDEAAEVSQGEETLAQEDSGADDAVTAPSEVVDIGDDDLLQKIQSGIGVSLNGYYVLNSYPDNMTGGGMVLTADPGNKLLILSFSLTNRNSGAVTVDFLSANATFWLMINGEHVSKNLVTLLDNDLSTYYSEIGGGDTAGAVLCFNVSEELAKKIDSISLKMNYHGEEQLLKIE